VIKERVKGDQNFGDTFSEGGGGRGKEWEELAESRVKTRASGIFGTPKYVTWGGTRIEEEGNRGLRITVTIDGYGPRGER